MLPTGTAVRRSPRSLPWPSMVNVTLSEPEQTVEAGGSVTFDVEVRNGGDTGQSVRLSVDGDAAPYSWVLPDRVSIEPGDAVTARVGFRLPAGPLPRAGELGFAVKASGAGADNRAAAAQGVLRVAPFTALSTTLDPFETGGRRSARVELCVANRGNAPAAVKLEAQGDDLDVRFAAPVLTVTPDEPSTSAVELVPRRRLLTSGNRTLPFKVVATPTDGAPAEAEGRFVQQALVAARTLVGSGVVAGLMVIALVAGASIFSGRSNPSDPAEPTVSSQPGPDCPAAGHIDRFGVSGLKPDDIFNLPNTYSFFHVKADGCTPMRFNPCEPVSYVQNAAVAPPTGVADVQEAFRQLSKATGITFVDEGLTDETNRRRPYVPDRYGQRWAPILVQWMHFGDQGDDATIQVVGRGIGMRVNEVLVSGTLSLNVDAVTDKEAGTPLEGGFGPPLGSGVGSIGPKGVTWGRVILHELAHVVGLGHTRDKGAIMYPETADQTSRPAEYKEPDLAGLRYLGRESGCLTTPPVPAG
jgi:hypothetical protein